MIIIITITIIVIADSKLSFFSFHNAWMLYLTALPVGEGGEWGLMGAVSMLPRIQHQTPKRCLI